MEKIVTIDFDGVLIEKVLGRDWKNQGKNKVVKEDWKFRLYRLVDMTWAIINHWWRKPVEGSKQGLVRLKKQEYSLSLLTSRRGYLREITFWWLRKWGYYELFNDFHFNDRLVGSVQSKIDNVAVVKPVMHVDDNWETVEGLAKDYPKLKLWLLNSQKQGDLANIIPVSRWGDIEK